MQIKLKKKQLFTHKPKRFYGKSVVAMIEAVLPFWSLENGVTQSMLMEWLACREKARLAYIEGWSSVQTSNAINFGSLFHEVLERIYRQPLSGKIDYETIIKEVLIEFKKEVSKQRIWGTQDEADYALNEGYLQTLVPAYLKNYQAKDKLIQWTHVEEEFFEELNGVKFRGKFDRVENANGEVWIWDTKTKSRIEPDLQDRLSFDFQMMVYITAYQTKTGVLPNGFVYDIIKRPALRRGMDETLQHFVNRVAANVDKDYFQRIRIRLDKERYQRWLGEFNSMVYEFLDWTKNIAPESIRNPAACQTPYGLCKFVKVCGLNDFQGLYKRKKVFQELGG